LNVNVHTTQARPAFSTRRRQVRGITIPQPSACTVALPLSMGGRIARD
jgi:hypothetical protein